MSGEIGEAAEGIAALFRGEDSEQADLGAALMTEFVVKVVHYLSKG